MIIDVLFMGLLVGAGYAWGRKDLTVKADQPSEPKRKTYLSDALKPNSTL